VIPESVLDDLRLEPGKKPKLHKRETGWAFSDALKTIGKYQLKDEARAILERNRTELAEVQSVLYAAGTHAVLVVLQAMDAGGKDGTIKHVMAGVNPQGCRVWSFKVPSTEERAHDFLWRYAKRLPERGMLGIFNRSYYEDVLVVRVHPELLGPHRPKHLKKVWRGRFADINAFERHLTRSGTTVLKFFLHISKDEQKRRLLDRLDDPSRRWKFSAADLEERKYWDDYEAAYEDALAATSTKWAPWYVIPADHKWVARTAVAAVLTRAIRALELRYPKLPPDQEAELAAARRALERE
jgi:PPK2 family polyphosphate:nucleotide phosphotransferase